MCEREKNYKLIYELFDELKSLLANYPNNRVDFEFTEDDGVCWDGEEYEPNEFAIYYGSSWYHDDELIIKSIYVEDDELYFDGSWMAWNHKGNVCGEEEFDHIWVDLLFGRSSENTDFLVKQLQFFVDIIKK